MAKKIDTIAITIDAQQAVKEFQKLEKALESLKGQIRETRKARKEALEAGDMQAYGQLTKQMEGQVKQAKSLRSLVKGAVTEVKGLDDILKNISKVSYNELIQAQQQLNKAIKSAKPNTKDYVELQNALRKVNGQMDKLKSKWKEHDNQLVATIRRLSAYVAVYGGFNAIVGQLKKVFDETLQLSDALADVQKTTGLAGDELGKLSKEINAMDTRSTQLELHALAATAGQLGLDSREDVLGFVKSANQLNVALNELGQDGVESLAKIAMLTGEMDRLGVEQSMIAIGSAINDLSASSAATAGPITDFMRYVGGIAPMANLATSDLVALGATSNALGQQMEVSGTAMSKFISSVVNNTEGIAYALNMDAQSLKDLVETGQTMEAVIQVLEKVKLESESGGAALNDVFKEFGSEGERMVRVIYSLSENTGFLREQVNLSTKAFEEATSVTNEYNVKNENAAALMERIGNVWREVFVDESGAGVITKILEKVLELSKFLTGASNAAVTFRSALLGLGAALISSQKSIRGLFAGLGELITGIKVTDSSFVGHIRTLITAKKTTDAYKNAVTALNTSMKAFMAANWFTLLATAVASAAYALSNWNKEQKELDAALVELNSEMRKEKKVLEEVGEELEKVKGDTEARGSLIREINRTYGDYLSNQLDEAAGYDEIAKALKVVNEQLDLKYAKQIYAKRMERAEETYTTETEDTQKDLANRISEMREFSNDADSVYKDVLVAVKRLAKEAQDPLKLLEDTSFDAVLKSFGPNGVGWKIDGDEQVEKFFKKLLKAELDYNKASKDAKIEQAANIELQEQELTQAQSELLESQRAQMKELVNLPAEALKEMDKLELKNHYERILNYGNAMLREAEKQYEEFRKANPKRDDQTQDEYNRFLLDKRADLQDTLTGGMVGEIEEIRKAYAGDAWGKAFNINGWKTLVDELDKTGTASVKSLVDTYKEMEEATQKYTDVNELNRVFKTNYTNITDMQLYIRSLAQKLEQALNAQGRNTSGGFLKDKSDAIRREKEQEMKKEYEAAKSALEAYYKEQERIINDSYLRQEITMEERNRRLAYNQQEMQRSFVDLYSVILSETKQYNTDFEKILPGKNLVLLAKNLQEFGPAMVDGIKNARAESALEIQREAIKMRETVEKALLEGDMFGKLEDEFRTMLDELSLLSKKFGTEFIAVDESMASGLVRELTALADKAYTVTAEGLREQALRNTEYAAWWRGATEDQLTLLLSKLQGYYDSRLEMQRRYAQRMQREWQQYYKQTGGEAEYEANKRLIEGAKNEPEGYVKDAGDYNRERGIIAAEAALEVEKVDSNIAFLQEKLKARALSVNKITADMIAHIKAAMTSLDENSPEYKNYQAQIALMEQSAMKTLVDSGDAEVVALNANIAEQTQNMNAIIQQSEIETTQLTIEQWQKRAEAASEWAELIGESFTEVAILQHRADQARLKGDEETAKELEQQAEESRQNAVKAALNKAIDMAKVWAMELGMKVMYNSLAKKSDEDVAKSGVQTTVKGVLAEIIAQGFKGAGKEIGSNGMAGLLTGAAIIAAAAGLAAAAKAAVAQMYPEATEGVSDGSTATKRKLTTGMLTYAEGKYPVLGNDGVVYDAKYAGAGMQAGIYRGPHYGIFSEKEPEMVIDGKTTRRLVMDFPALYNDILTLSRTGHLGMRTYADGNVAEAGAATAMAAQQQIQMEEMRNVIQANMAAMAALTAELRNGISANVSYFGKGGVRDAETRGGRWAKRNRVP